MTNINIFAPELRGIVRKEVPFIEGAWVDFFDDVTMDTVQKAQNNANNQDALENIKFIVNQISDWNFSDESYQKLPIDVNSINKMPVKLVRWLSDSYASVLTVQNGEEKKSE